MYKTKPCFPCGMPSDARLNVLALNASLKHDPDVSNTGELASLVLDEIRALAPVDAMVVRLSDAKRREPDQVEHARFQVPSAKPWRCSGSPFPRCSSCG